MMPDTDSLARVQQFLREVQTYQERLRSIPLPDRADPEELLRYLRELRQPTTPNLGQATLEAAGRDLAELARLQRAFSVGEGLVMHAGPHGIHIAATGAAPSGLPLADSHLWEWAVASENWINAAGNGSYVNCHPCVDSAGTGEDTDVDFKVYLPRNGSTQDPNVVNDAVIPYLYDATGIRVCQGAYLDGTIAKSVQIWEGAHATLAADKPGWAIWTRLEGLSPIFWKTGDDDYGCLANTGGFTWHGGTENNHDPHCVAHTHCVSTGMNCVDSNLDATYVARFDSTDSGAANWGGGYNVSHGGPYNTYADTDNRPPWGVLYLVIRDNNAAG